MRQSEESAGSHSEPTLRAGDADRWHTNAVLRSSIRAVRYIGTLPRRHTNLWVLFGQDGGQSIDLGDRTLFVFSDTLLAFGAIAHHLHS